MEQSTMRRTSNIVVVVAVLTCLFEPLSAVGKCIPTPSGLISHWTGDLDARDVWAGNDGVLVNGAIAGVSGQVGGAFRFDGDDDSVRVASNPVFDLTNALTMEAWIKLTALKGDQKVLSYISSYEMGIYNDKLELLTSESSIHRSVPGGTVLQISTWYHVVTTWDGETITSYINGAVDRSIAYSDPLAPGVSDFRIGDTSDGGISFFGLIDEATLYSRALTASEVQEHYQGGLLHQEFCLFVDGFEGLREGSVCTENAQCVRGLLCCYPCGISGCENQCTVPVEESCPLFP